MNDLKITVPRELAWQLRMQDREFEQEFKQLALVKLFEMGRISSGLAARTLGISRLAFIESLGHYQVSVFNDSSEEQLREDLNNA
jgi:predicted HTH domain antitoxin